MFWFSLQLWSETVLILRRTERNIKNVYCSSCRVSIILVRLQWNLNFLDRFSKKKNTHISNLVKICPVTAVVFHADGRTDRYDKANSLFSQFCERAQKSHNCIADYTSTFFPSLLKNCSCHTVFSKAFFVFRNTLLGRDKWNRKYTTNLLPNTTLYYCETGIAQPI